MALLPSISIAIPVFNQWRFTAPCIEALKRTAPTKEECPNFEIIFVDNGSTDETQLHLQALAEQSKAQPANSSHPRFIYIRNEKNLGFNEASNQGARAAQGEILIFLNNDTIPQPGWVQGLLAALNLEKVGIVGPKLLFPDTHTINHIGYAFNQALGGFYPLYFNYPATFPPACKPREFKALLGACLMIRKSLFEQLGMFSLEGLEDIDLCMKVREAGLRVLFTPRAEVWHHGGATFQNSEPSAVPRMTNEAFFKRWPLSSIAQDDVQYYREDGFSMELQPGPSINLIQEHDLARALLTEARALWEGGNRISAIDRGLASVAIYKRNITSLREVSSWLINEHRTEEARALMQELEFLAGMR